jgi:hypothetical protein
MSTPAIALKASLYFVHFAGVRGGLGDLVGFELAVGVSKVILGSRNLKTPVGDAATELFALRHRSPQKGAISLTGFKTLARILAFASDIGLKLVNLFRKTIAQNFKFGDLAPLLINFPLVQLD